MLVDGEKLNLTRLLSRLSGDHELLRGGPKDQFGTKASVTADAVIVQIGLELRNSMGGGVRRHAGRVVLVPEPVTLGGLGAAET